MKKVLLFSICSLLSFTASFGQYFNVSHLTGSAVINGVTVTVTSVNGMSTPWCGVNPYWIGGGGVGTYTFTFSQPVYGVRAEMTAMNDGELNTFEINGAPYTLTNANLSVYLGNCNQAQAVINFGGLWGPPGTPNQPGIGGQIDIEDCNGITSCSVTNNGVLAGTTFSFYFTTTVGGGSANVTAGSNSPVCEGQTINLTCSNVAGGNYQWSGPGGFSSNQQNPSITNATTGMSGDYIVTATGPCGPDTDTVNVQVLPLPNIAGTILTNPSTCNGTNGSITLTGLAASSPFSVSYTLNGNTITLNLTSDASGNIIIPNLSQGSYTNISVTNAAGCSSNIVTGTLTDPPTPAAPNLASNSPVCEYGTITLTATSVAGGSFNWTGPNGFMSVQQNPSITNAQLNYEGNYSATVTVNGCVSPPSTIFVDVIPTPLAPVTANVVYCQHDIATPLTATGTSLLWYTSQTGTGSATPPTPSTQTAGTTIYWVTQTVNGCESPQAMLTVIVKPQPPAPVYSGPVHFCLNDPSSPLSVTGQNVQWFDNNHNLLPGAPTPVTSVPGDFVWYATQTVNGCESPEATIQIHVADIPPAPVTADLTYCQHDPVTALTALGQNLKWYNAQSGTAPLIYPPVPNTSVPGTRTWWVSQTVDGCEGPTAPLTVTVNFLPTSTFVASRPLVCENDTLTFTYTGNGNGMGTYAWTWAHDSVILVDGVTNTPGPLTIRFDEVGTFPITLTVDSLGCNTTFTYNVRVAPIPGATISMPTDVCIGDSVTVGLGDYNQALTTFAWDFDGGLNVLNHINEGPYQVQWNTPGIHIIEAVVGNGACETAFVDTVLVHNYPSARFTLAEPASSICVGDSLRLAAIDNNGLYSYEWAPASFFNQSNNYAPVVNAYVRAAEYVTLTVATPWGCSATETVYLDAQSCCTVALPNAFTPNGDGKNDIFRPITQGNHAIKQFLIVDRWGKKVYESTKIKEGWNGTLNGEDQDIGTYYYIFRYICEGKTMDLKGEVILVR